MWKYPNQVKNQLCFLFLYVFVIWVFFTYCTSFTFLPKPHFNNTQARERIEESGDVKTILYWTPMFERDDYYIGIGFEPFQNCSFKNCYTTSNKDLFPVEKFDAIVFHGPQYSKEMYGKPKKRRLEQVYIFFNQESPLNTGSAYTKSKNFYNWTMTYRLDSDIVHKYGSVQNKTTTYKLPKIEDVAKKTKKIAWFVSHCTTASKREKITKELAQYIPLDVYGPCGDNTCPRTQDCYSMLETNYKFYLSFENSLCKDYVTEKLYNILQKNVVPIVYSGADLTKLTPPNSVINVLDFNTTATLAQYINFIDEHPEEYVEFFKWKKSFVVDTSLAHSICALCEKLNGPIQPKIYEDVGEWWAGKNFNVCRNSSRKLQSYLYVFAILLMKF